MIYLCHGNNSRLCYPETNWIVFSENVSQSASLVSESASLANCMDILCLLTFFWDPLFFTLSPTGWDSLFPRLIPSCTHQTTHTHFILAKSLPMSLPCLRVSVTVNYRKLSRRLVKILNFWKQSWIYYDFTNLAVRKMEMMRICCP